VTDLYNTRAEVKSRDGEKHTYIGCNHYRLETSFFGMVLRVIGFNGTAYETVGVFYQPISASVGAMEPEQVAMVKKRRQELEAVLT
jgi:hypothetical protein